MTTNSSNRDTQYVNAILKAIQHVFNTMLDLSISFENPVIKTIRNPCYAISSIIGISGAVKGCIVLSLPRQVAITIAGKMLEDIEIETDENLIDAICEITNMVIGSADTEMAFEGVYYSLPTVSNEKHKIVYPNDTFIFSMACLFESGKFDVDIALLKN